jgi:hypothetical protein
MQVTTVPNSRQKHLKSSQKSNNNISPKSQRFSRYGVRNFKNGLNKILNENTTDLETAMARYVLVYCTGPHATTKTSPVEIMFGWKLRIRLDNVKLPTVTTSAINNPNKASSSEFTTGETVMVHQSLQPTLEAKWGKKQTDSWTWDLPAQSFNMWNTPNTMV